MSTARVDLNATIAPQLATVANVHAERIDDLADDQRKILVGASPIVLDIETVADLDWIASSEEAWLAAYDPPGNMTKPETIAANIAEALKSRVSKAPLRALDGKVIAAGIARLWGDGDPVAWAGDEREVLGHLSAWMELVPRPVLCGYGIRIFDIPFLQARYAALDLEAHWLPNPRDYRGTIDALDLLPGKLDVWLARFGLPRKTASGADVATMTVEEVRAYCAHDVHVERALLRRLSHVYPSLRRLAPAEHAQP